MHNYSKLNKGGFSEVYLIFDFDFQAPQYDENKISEMVKFFDNETEYGKLYINYPMIESFKHFITLPDYNFNSYKVDKNDCITYKHKIDSISAIKHFNDITNNILKIIIKQNLDKYFYLINKDLSDYESYIDNFFQERLLNLQIENLKKDEKIYVINTCVFWEIDYFGKSKFNEYNYVFF